jgi:hypothetical protein
MRSHASNSFVLIGVALIGLLTAPLAATAVEVAAPAEDGALPPMAVEAGEAGDGGAVDAVHLPAPGPDEAPQLDDPPDAGAAPELEGAAEPVVTADQPQMW